MSKTEVSGKQVKDGSIELVDLSTALSNTISGKAEAADVTALDTRVTAVESDVVALQSASAPNLSDLGEVSITSPSSGQVLKYNGTGWANTADSTFSGDYADLSNKPTIPSALDDLSDVTISSPSNDQVLKYNGTAWVNAAAASGGASDLDGLSDVAITSAAKGQFIVHNGTSFVNSNTIEASAAAVNPLIVKGAASQSANLFEIQNSSATALISISSSGQTNLAGGGWNSCSLAVTGAMDNSPTFASAGMYVGVTGGYTFMKLQGSNTAIIDFQGVSTNDWKCRLIGNYPGAGCFGIGTSNSANTSRDYVAKFGGWDVTYPAAQFETKATTAKGLVVKAIASQTANLFEVQTSAGTTLTTISSDGTVHTKRYTETVANAFNSSLDPSSGTLTVDTSLGNAVLGALSASVTTWAFTNVPTDNSKVTTVTAVLAGNASYTYGDACSVNGSAVSNGIMWSGGSAPTATAGTDIITFIIVKDSAGTVKVFGSATTNFS